MGYDPAENSLDRMHGVGKYDVISGAPIPSPTPAKVHSPSLEPSSQDLLPLGLFTPSSFFILPTQEGWAVLFVSLYYCKTQLLTAVLFYHVLSHI